MTLICAATSVGETLALFVSCYMKRTTESYGEFPERFHALIIDSLFHLGVMKIKLNNYFELL